MREEARTVCRSSCCSRAVAIRCTEACWEEVTGSNSILYRFDSRLRLSEYSVFGRTGLYRLRQLWAQNKATGVDVALLRDVSQLKLDTFGIKAKWQNKKGANNQSAASLSVRSYLFWHSFCPTSCRVLWDSCDISTPATESESKQMFICYREMY